MRKMAAMLCCAGLAFGLLFSACASSTATSRREEVRIVMSAPADMRDPAANHYKSWLEEATGLSISLELVAPAYMPEYLRLLSLAEETEVDALFFAPGDGVTAELVESYGAGGHILPLDGFVENTTNLAALFEAHTEYDLEAVLTAGDGQLYYMPNLNTSRTGRGGQTLWLNAAWLGETGKTMPLTTGDFAEVLRAFYEKNAALGPAAGVPVAGSGAGDAQFIIHYLMNAFAYTDPAGGYLAVEKGRVVFPPATEAWRQGLLYCRELYEEGLLPNLCFSFTEAQFVRLVNDPRDLVGGFTAAGVGDVLAAGSPALNSRYIHIPPLRGPNGAQFAAVRTSLPTPGGVITASCKNPGAVFRLMDTMLGEDAYLVAAFGRQGEDWDYAGVGDIGYNGDAAVITVTSPEWDKLPDRHFGQAGPFVSWQRYADGVAWNGYQADQRYLDARAARVYEAYEPEEYIKVLLLDDEAQAIQADIKAYTRQMLEAFITGEKSPADEEAWRDYLDEFERLGLDRLLAAAQASHNQLEGAGG